MSRDFEELSAAGDGGDLSEFLRTVEEDGVEISEAKVVLAGEGAVGKSSLLAAFLGEPFIADRDTTHGVEIKPLNVTQADTTVFLNFWDFGGQPLYRPTHQLFFTESAVYLVVWKPRLGPELSLVSYWISLIKDRAGAGAKVHVVATHGGPSQHSAHLDESALIHRFGEMIAGFHHVDSKTREGIEQLRQAVTATALRIPHVTRQYPRYWRDVHNDLALIGEAYLSYDEYEKVAGKRGLSPTSARAFAKNAHALGCFIYYDDDPALRDLVILRPDWLSVTIGFVLDDPVTQQNGGLLPHRRLANIWDNPLREPHHRYSHSMQQMFLRLMEQFDLSYRAPELAEPLSLIPQLLPGEPPKVLTQFLHGTDEAVNICQFVEEDTGRPATPPPGLMARLIALFHRFSLGRNDISQSVHWQHGLVLEDRYGARALLKIEGMDLSVHVKGVNPTGFLNLLVREIQTYVENFWIGLRTRVLVPCPQKCTIAGVHRGQFNLDNVYRRLANGKPTAECQGPMCGHDVEISSILGSRQSSQVEAVISEAVSGTFAKEIGPLLQAQTEQILKGTQNQITDGLWELSGQLDDQARKLFSQIDERLTVLMRAFDDEGNDGPRLFSMERVRKLSATTYRMRLTLWCEHSRIPVHLLESERPNAGVYTVDVPRDWWVKAAPVIKTTSTLLKAFLPLGLPVIKADMSDEQWKGVEEQLTVLKESFGAAASLGVDAEAHVTFEPTRAEGALLRMLHATLREQDITFADLRKVRAGQRILWVHPRYERVFNPELPQIPR